MKTANVNYIHQNNGLFGQQFEHDTEPKPLQSTHRPGNCLHDAQMDNEEIQQTSHDKEDTG
jgi:hypothetical protein